MSWSTAQIIREKTSQVLPNVDRDLHRSLAIAYLRLGEQENCLEMHGQKSCIFPIRGSGVHSATRGAQGAARELTTLLNADPRDEISRWLLNIAYMQLGQYPGKVPKQWLVPESNFASEYDIGEFPDVAPGVNLGITEHSGGIIVDDFDGDGLLDVMLSSSGPLDQLHFFHNNGDGTFSDRTRQAGLTGELAASISSRRTTTTTGIPTCWCCAGDGGASLALTRCRCSETTATAPLRT